MTNDSEKIRESAKKHFTDAREIYKTFATQLQPLDRKFFDFRIAFSGFLGIILTIALANRENFSCYFPFEIIVVFILSSVFLFYEIWEEGKGKMQDLNVVERTTILFNILNSAIQRNQIDYAKNAIKIIEQENKIIQAMKDKKTIEEIITISSRKRKWNFGLFLWILLVLSVPVLFLIELF